MSGLLDAACNIAGGEAITGIADAQPKLHANPQAKRGENRYSLEQFGLDDAEVREAFAVDIDHFTIPSEAQGVAGH